MSGQHMGCRITNSNILKWELYNPDTGELSYSRSLWTKIIWDGQSLQTGLQVPVNPLSNCNIQTDDTIIDQSCNNPAVWSDTQTQRQKFL